MESVANSIVWSPSKLKEIRREAHGRLAGERLMRDIFAVDESLTISNEEIERSAKTVSNESKECIPVIKIKLNTQNITCEDDDYKYSCEHCDYKASTKETLNRQVYP